VCRKRAWLELTTGVTLVEVSQRWVHSQSIYKIKRPLKVFLFYGIKGQGNGFDAWL